MPAAPSPDLTRRPRTRRVFSDADMIRLRDLYYDPRVSMVQLSGAFGVSASTLYHWIAEMDWPRRSAQAPALDSRRDLFAQVEAEHRAEAQGQGKRRTRRTHVVPVDRYELARQVGLAAQRELNALAAEREPVDPIGRRRRANVIDTLSRAVARMERVAEQRSKDYARMANEVEKLAKVLRGPKPAPQRKRDRPIDYSKPNWWL